jgi:hypothetical protein
MPRTIRKFWPGPFQGRTALNFNWGAIDSDSVVLITASEYLHQNNPPAGANLQRFVGGASIRVDNIAPHGPPFDNNHGVTFVVTVEWGSPLFIVTDITVLDDKPLETQTT